MPKPSLKSEDLSKGGRFGIQGGKVEVAPEGARFKIVQYEKGDGSKVTPMFVLQLDVYQLDDEWDRLQESEQTGPEQHNIIVCWQDKKTGGFKFRPGLADSPTAQPEDAGDEIDAEGPTLYCDDESIPFADSEIGMFMTSLEKKGWSAAVNAQAWAPNYAGAKFEIKAVSPSDLCKRYGIKHKTGDKEQPVWEILDIHTKPYESKTGTKAAGGKANGKAKDVRVDEDQERDVADGPELNETAVAVLSAYGEAHKGETFSAKQLQTGLGPFMMQKYKNDEGKKLQMNEQTKVIGAVRDVEMLAAMAAHVGAEYDKKTRGVTFGE